MMQYFTKSQQQIDKEQRMAMIAAKQQEEKYRRPSPLGDAIFPDSNFIDFKVIQDNQPIKLHVYRYPPDLTNMDAEPASIVVLFHGLNGHLGTYAHIAKAIAEQTKSVSNQLSYEAVVGFDYRGFGRSQGYRGLIESEQQHFQDCEKFLDLLRQYYYNLFQKEFPLFLGGQSLGGMTSYMIGLKGTPWLRGTILIAPAIKDNGEQRAGKSIAKVLGVIMPRVGLVAQKHGQANKNPQISENSLKDPYMYQGKMIPGTIRSLLNCIEVSQVTFSQFKIPFLLIQGGIDKMVDPSLAEELMEKSPSTDKTLIYRENMWHNVIQEEEIEEIIPQMVKWVRERL